MRTPFLVIASHRRWRGNPVNYVRAYARDSIHLDPGVKPQDDMFLSFFILRFFSIVIPAQAGIHCAAGICVAFATT